MDARLVIAVFARTTKIHSAHLEGAALDQDSCEIPGAKCNELKLVRDGFGTLEHFK
jgi:hypothetical protein